LEDEPYDETEEVAATVAAEIVSLIMTELVSIIMEELVVSSIIIEELVSFIMEDAAVAADSFIIVLLVAALSCMTEPVALDISAADDPYCIGLAAARVESMAAPRKERK